MKRLTVFAGYDPDDLISDYVLYYLRELKKVSDIVIVFDNKLSEVERRKLNEFAMKEISENHGEYDFGSYKRGYQWAKDEEILSHYDVLVFCNDSMFGPFYDLEPILESFESDLAVDFWGMFKIVKKHHHVQGYFMAFSARVFLSDVFDRFITSIQKVDRSEVVSKYEIGLSDELHRAGFKSSGKFVGERYCARNKDAIRIIEQGFPFLKKALFMPAPGSITCDCIYRYERAVKKACPSYDIGLIKFYLLRFISESDFSAFMRRSWMRTNFKTRFLYEDRITISGKRLIKILRIPVYNRLVK